MYGGSHIIEHALLRLESTMSKGDLIVENSHIYAMVCTVGHIVKNAVSRK